MKEWYLLGILFYNSITDGIWRVIPLKINMAGCVLGAFCFFRMYGWSGLGELLAGILIGAAVLCCARITEGAIGTGDGMLFTLTGCWLGGKENLLLFVWSCFMAGLFSGGLLMIKKAGRKTEIPMAPFVLAVYVGRMVLQ